jgi:peptidoglycan-associated lipoprotein
MTAGPEDNPEEASMHCRAVRTLLAAMLVATGLFLVTSCKTAQPRQETPTTQPPSFESRPAEKVQESGAFDQKDPSEKSFQELPAGEADKLNAQGILKAIHFDFDAAELRPDALQTLNDDAGRIREHAPLGVRVEGHCDERGTSEYNLALGDRRARAARDYLVSLGIPANRLRTISYGKERPVDPGHGEDAWSKNRRAEFVFIAE